MSLFNPFKQKLPASKHVSEILSGASRSLLIKILGLFTAYLFAFAVTRLFGAQAWGIFSLAISVIMFSTILGSAGLDIAMLKQTASLDNTQEISSVYEKAFTIVSILSICMSLVTYLMSEWIAATLFNNPELTPAFKIASFGIFPFCMLNLNARILQGLKQVNKYVFIRFVSHHFAALFLLLILYLFWEQSKIILIAYTGGLYIIFCLSFLWLKIENIWPFQSIHNKTEATVYYRLIQMSMPLLFANILIFTKGWIDTIMVGFFMTEQDVGIYNIALKLSGLLLFVLTSVNAVIAPNFSKLYSQKSLDDLKNMIRYSSSLIFFTTIPLFLILVIFPEQILSVFGEEFTAGSDVLIILCIGSFLSAFAGSVGYFMQMTDSQVAFQNITLAAALTGFILNLILIPRYGIEGAAIATSASMIFWNGACVFYIKKKYNIVIAYWPF